MSGFGNLKPKTGGTDSLRLNEVIEMHSWPSDEWSVVRFLPTPILPVRRHWIKIIAGKEKKEITIPRYCISFNPHDENEPRKDEKGKDIECPYCSLTHGQDGSARYEFFYLANAIVREIQEDEPRKKAQLTKEEKKTGFKDIRSKSWTPVRVCRITSSVAIRMQELSESNMVKTKKGKVAYDITHPKYGCDVRVKYKPKAAGTDKYSADKDERTPMTEEEQGYLVWKLDDELLDVTGRMGAKQALEDFKRMDIVGGDTVEGEGEGIDLGDDDDDDSGSFSKSKKSKKSSKSKRSAFDDDDDDDEPKKPKKTSKKKKSSADDKPVKKAKKKPAFEDDEDDEPKKSSKKSKKTTEKSSKKSKKTTEKKPAKKKSSKKSPWDEDDE